jgi:tRNA (guanine10-N2)-dimethyltransferase
MNEQTPLNLELALVVSKANLEMSKAEAIESCKIYFEIASTETIDNLLLLTLNLKAPDFFQKISIWLNRLAFTKEAHIVLGQKENNTLTWNEWFDKTKLQQIKHKTTKDSSFKISTRNSLSSSRTEENKKTSITALAKQITNAGFKNINMTSPDIEFVILSQKDSSQELIGALLWQNLEPFEERKAHLRPVLHPTSLDPRLARAMINLAGAEKEVFDPFCGTGGILLEAGLLNLKALGTDIDPLMIGRAILNLKEQKNVALQEMDALTWNNKVECVVTDLPYGKSSKLKGSIGTLLQTFLKHYAPLAKRIVVCFPEGTPFDIPNNLTILHDFRIYIHKSLTRRILVLNSNI